MPMQTPRAARLVGIAAIAALAVACLLVLKPFISALIWAAILAFSTWPVFAFLRDQARIRPSWSAALMVLAMFLLVGLPIAIAGTVGYIIAGLRQDDLPRWSAGYVYLPAMAVIVVASMLSAPIGAHFAHRWPPLTLRRAFAALLYVLGAYMLWKAIRG